MNTLVPTTHVVNQARVSFTPDVEARLLDAVALIHSLIGALIVVTAVLFVATAGPRWRSRITAAIIALLMVGVVVAGCAPAASAATPVAATADEPGVVLVAVLTAVVAAVGAFLFAALRMAFHALAIVARALELVLVAGNTLLVTGIFVLTLIAVVARA
jgi:hypothetical protein